MHFPSVGFRWDIQVVTKMDTQKVPQQSIDTALAEQSGESSVRDARLVATATPNQQLTAGGHCVTSAARRRLH